VALIAFQLFAIKAICMWCMAADVAALVAAAAAYWVAQHEPPSEPRGRRMLWAGVGVVAVTLPLVWAEAPERVALPAGLEALQVEGRINVVEFTDFECPYCRKLHPKLAELEKRHEGKLVLTRLMRPLKGHPGAEPAARAYLCASTEKQDAIAAALYEAPPAQLTTSGTVAIAGQVGLDTVAFARCLGSRETAAELERHNQMFIDSGLDAVPSTFVEDQLVRGFDEPRLSAAVRRAAAGGGQPGVEWMLALLGVLVVGVGWTSLKEPPRADEADEDDTADEDPGDDGATEDAAESGSDAV